MAGDLSLFGGADPADTPDADRCPSCAGPTTTGAECHACRARGYRAGHLALTALTTCNACDAAPMAPGQEAPGEAGYCGDCLAGVVLAP